MAFDNPDAYAIRDLPECQGFMGLPFVVYYRGGKIVKATSGSQSKQLIEEILKQEFV